MMGAFVLEPTIKSPLFEFSPSGYLVIEGKAINYSAEDEFLQAINWCQYIKAGIVNLTIKLDYLNIASSRQLFNLFSTLANNTNIKVFCIHWYMDIDDVDLIETGHIFREIFPEISFTFHYI